MHFDLFLNDFLKFIADLIIYFVKNRNQLSEKLLFGKAGEVNSASWLYAFTIQSGISTVRENAAAKGGKFISVGIFIMFFFICLISKYAGTSASFWF